MKRIICIVLSSVIMLSLFGCKNAAVSGKFSDNILDAFDTVTTVTAYDKSKAEFDTHFEKFKSELERYDRLFSIYDSFDGVTNLKTINETAKQKPVKVDKEIVELLVFGKECYKNTNGTVNICMGSVLKLWHDARETSLNDKNKAYIPDKKALKEASKHTDIENLVIDESASTVYFKDSKMSLDVGAIAKGFAAQKIANEKIWNDCVISIGGNVITSGYKDDNAKWNIEIENPNEKSTEQFEVLSTTDKCIVTSGSYQRYFTVNGKNYCHIIDPKTLMPAEDFTSVTVICDDSALADALSTALFILPLNEGKALVEKLDGVEAMWADKSFKKTYSKGFESYIKE